MYVDDIVLTVFGPAILQRTISALQREFAMKDLGQLHYFLSLPLSPHPSRLMFLQQRAYTGDLSD